MTQEEIESLVTEGASLAKKIAAMKVVEKRLEEIKETLRGLASGLACGECESFKGKGGEVATVSKVADMTVRSVPVEKLARVTKLAGDFLLDLFSLSPSKGQEKSFELNAIKTLSVAKGVQLVELLKVPAQPRVSFEG